jgi:hypothetical protein
MMYISCPKDKDHKVFNTVVHVTEDWDVDPDGNFIQVAPHSETQVVHGPTKGNTFTCVDCGAEAKVED